MLLDGELPLEDVSFRTASECLRPGEGTHEIEVTAAGDPQTAVFNDELSVEPGAATTLAAIRETGADAFEVRTYVDDISPVQAGESGVKTLQPHPTLPT